MRLALLGGLLALASMGFDDVIVESKILDGVTGEPIPAFVIQGGRADPKVPGKVDWGNSEGRVRKARVDGSFRTSIDWAGGQRLRILAPGYAPQVVLAGPPPEGARAVEITVYLTRGREIAGTIRDSRGRPVPEASVFLVGRRQSRVNVTGGEAFLDHDTGPDWTVTRTRSADDGRYAIFGAEDDDCLVVSAPGLDFWSVPLPLDPNAPFEICLPEPGRLSLKYDMPGAAESTFRLRRGTDATMDRDEIDNVREFRVANGATKTLPNLAPGLYELARTKGVRLGDAVYLEVLDRKEFEVKPGGSIDTDFTRAGGPPITGRVDWPGREASSGAVLRVERRMVGDDRPGPVLDAVTVGPDGKFTTGNIPPGDYTISAFAPFLTRRVGRFDHTFHIPDYAGSVRVTVPPRGTPTPVTLTLKIPGQK